MKEKYAWLAVLWPPLLVVVVAVFLAWVVSNPDHQAAPGASAIGNTTPAVIRNSLGMELIRIPAGPYLMGAGEGARSAFPEEHPAHQVTVPAFYISRFEVTQAQWQSVMGSNPSHFRDPQRPVEQVSWLDAQAFVHELNRREGARYRLPSEAEWEYAARAGSQANGPMAATELSRLAWYAGNAGSKSHHVGKKAPNDWGLHDMLGNVWEWVGDCWHDSYDDAPADHRVPPQNRCNRRVLRGGAWDSDLEHTQLTIRGSAAAELGDIDVGFRLVRAN